MSTCIEERILIYLEMRNISLSMLSKILNVEYSTLYAMLHKKDRITVSNFLKIVDKLNISDDEILTIMLGRFIFKKKN